MSSYNQKPREMFACKEQITSTLEKFSSVEDKRAEIIKTSGELWYIFGYELVSKPWLTYQERYDIL